VVGPVSVLRTALAVVVGGAMGVGLLLVVAGFRGQQVVPRPRPSRPDPSRGRPAARAGFALAVGAAAFALTGWPAAGVVVVAGVLLGPGLLGGGGVRPSTSITEALAEWAQMLRDTLRAAGGLEQAVIASAQLAPEAIEAPVRRLAIRADKEPLRLALRAFADELSHPVADKLAVALSLAATEGTADIGALLGRLADSAEQEARMVLRVEVSRARVRTAVRIITGCVVVFALVLSLARREYLEPYGTPAGQLALLVVAGLFVLGLWLLQRMARVDPPERLFTADPRAFGELG